MPDIPELTAEEAGPDRRVDAADDRAEPERRWSGTMASTAARLWRELPADAAPDSGVGVDSAGSGSEDFVGWSPTSGGRHSRAEVSGVLRRVAARFQELRLDPGRRPAMAVIAVAVIAVLVTIALVWRARPTPEAVGAVPAAASASSNSSSAAAPAPSAAASAAVGPSAAASSGLVVAVTGKVRRPGLVHLKAGARVADAIYAAGGLRPGADIGLLNLARVLTDGEQVLVGIGAGGAAGSVPGGAVSGGSGDPASGDSGAASQPISLNTATAEQLDTLPGVGEVTAQKIIDYRTAHGPFRSIESLQDIPGIGPARYAEIAPEVTL